MSRYIDVVDSAKLIRVALKAKFPGVKFSVKSSRYAGGSSISIKYVDGPTITNVRAVTDPFAGAGFDGSIDLQYYKTAYLLPDGTAVFGKSDGTQYSHGYASAYSEPLPEGAEEVRFGSDYVQVYRDFSEGFLRSAVDTFNAIHNWNKVVLEVTKYGPRIDIVPYDTSVQAWWGNYIKEKSGDPIAVN